MDMNDYTLEIVARARLAELRAEAERWKRFEGEEPPPRRLRDVLGDTLVRMGTRMLAVRKSALSEVRS
jgi:hypothetical protein